MKRGGGVWGGGGIRRKGKGKKQNKCVSERGTRQDMCLLAH